MTQLTQLAQLRLWDFGTFGKCREALKIQESIKSLNSLMQNFKHALSTKLGTNGQPYSGKVSIDYQTPSQAHEQSGPQQRRWKGYQSTLSTNLG